MRLKTKEFECWVDMPDGSRFLVQDIPSQKHKEILARNSENPTGYIMDAYSYQFKDWQGIKDESGEEFPFSKKNLSTAINHDLETLNEVVQEFNKKLFEHKEAVKSAEGN